MTDLPGTLIGRIVVAEPPGQPAAAEDTLLEALTQQWPSGARVKFLITPGGFVVDDWPEDWSGCCSWQSRARDLKELVRAAGRALEKVVSRRVFAAARGKVDVLSIGVDLFTEGEPEHVELVAVFDVAAARLVRWTGKSYPTGGQEATLVQVADLDSHLLSIAGERVLLLGCHDLNMFSPRGYASQDPHGARRQRCDAMTARIREFRPTVILQHPHSTDTPRIWSQGWTGLLRVVPGVRAWASGISYSNAGQQERASLQDVLARTHGGETCLDVLTGELA